MTPTVLMLKLYLQVWHMYLYMYIYATILVLRCQALADGINTVSVDNISPYVFGDNYTYVCNDGYEYNGELVSTCQSDRTWSLSPPTCTGEIFYLDISLEFKTVKVYVTQGIR